MKTFLTEKNGVIGPRIEACDFEHAELLASNLGVEVIGEHKLTIFKDGFTDDDAKKLCKAMSESIEI